MVASSIVPPAVLWLDEILKTDADFGRPLRICVDRRRLLKFGKRCVGDTATTRIPKNTIEPSWNARGE